MLDEMRRLEVDVLLGPVLPFPSLRVVDAGALISKMSSAKCKAFIVADASMTGFFPPFYCIISVIRQSGTGWISRQGCCNLAKKLAQGLMNMMKRVITT